MDLTALLPSRLQFVSDVPLTPLHVIIKDAIFSGLLDGKQPFSEWVVSTVECYGCA
jgi:hypothetical protein